MSGALFRTEKRTRKMTIHGPTAPGDFDGSLPDWEDEPEGERQVMDVVLPLSPVQLIGLLLLAGAALGVGACCVVAWFCYRGGV